MDEFLAVIKLFAGNYAPQGWMFCNGQVLQISSNMALFSLLGTQYGGNGTTTFALPDLRGRVPVGIGQGPGLSNINIGQTFGTETVTLTVPQMPTHSHVLNAFVDIADKTEPAGALAANTKSPDVDYRLTGTIVPMNASGIGSAGGSQPHNNMQPSLGLSYIICVQGMFPPRS